VNCAINNIADDGLLLIAPTVLEAALRLRPKLHRFDLSLYLLQSWLYNIDTKSTKWSLSIIIQICGNNRHFSVSLAVYYQPTVIKLSGQCDVVNFALSSIARSIGVNDKLVYICRSYNQIQVFPQHGVHSHDKLVAILFFIFENENVKLQLGRQKIWNQHTPII